MDGGERIVTLKELPERELMTPGHRLCAGCAASMAARMALKAVRGPTILVQATGCLEVATTIYPYTAWEVPWVHIAFENAAAVASGIEAALKARGKSADIIALCGDGGTFDIGLQALSGALERGHDFVYICYDNEAYMNCLDTSSLIMTREGLKRITEVRVGDEIYAFDQKSHRLVLKKCVGVFDNGEREIYELTTLHHTIRATSNHPFLVLKRNGRGRKNELVWKTLAELGVGDEVTVLKNLDGGRSFKFNFKPARRGGKVTRLKQVNLPTYSSPTLMKYLGLWVGDGWVRPEKGEVGFALPQGSEGRNNLLKLHSALFNVKARTDPLYVYIDSVNLARFIASLGFGSGAKNKTIPPWVFTLPQKEREAFIEGLMLSDGYRIGNSFRYVSASHELLRRVKLLLQTMGYRVGKIHWQVKKKGSKCVRRRLLKDAEYGYICFSRRRGWNVRKYPSQYRYQNFLIENEHFEMEKIKQIRPVGRGPTLDLRVEGEHNFIADGIVVHNTGIQRSGATPRGAWTTTSPVGTVIGGKPEWKKDLIGICVAHGVEYAATACVSYWNDYITKVRKALAVAGPAVIHVLAPCPRGWRFDPSQTVRLGRLAVQTRYFPIYEFDRGVYRLNIKVSKPRPVERFLTAQGRFRHLFRPEFRKEIAAIQTWVDENWRRISELCRS
jgi:pyruvate/2-oxoacid:ferredoxin oxidoreductase beta subunit